MKKGFIVKKIVAIVTLFATLSLVLASCGNDKDKNFTLTVGFDSSFPPYGYVEKGEYKGFDLDLAREVAKRRGWKIELKPIDWDTKDAQLKAGQINCIWNGFTMNGREDKYTFSRPYIDNTQVMVVRNDGKIKTFADLKGKKVAVQTDSSALAALKEEEHKDLLNSFGKLDIQKEYVTSFTALEAGAVDAVAIDIGVAKDQINKKGNDKFKILDETISKEQYGVGFLKGNEKLRDEVQETLDEMIKDGTFKKIAEKYNLQDAIIETVPSK
ncbi:MAG: amino acid ABC transporter substrate-binding protein [Clostridia bacterium]|nr:amino acid ABC transporter substrate-binding protein [Clostridia bacterium]